MPIEKKQWRVGQLMGGVMSKFNMNLILVILLGVIAIDHGLDIFFNVINRDEKIITIKNGKKYYLEIANDNHSQLFADIIR